MARFTRVLTSKELVELDPYVKYLHQHFEEDLGDLVEFKATFKQLVKDRLVNRTPTVRLIANRYIADRQVTKLPKCLIV